MNNDVAGMLDHTIEVVEQESSRTLNGDAARAMRNEYRNFAQHVSQHGGFDSRYWKRRGRKLTDQLRVLAATAVEHAKGREDDDGATLTVADIQVGQEKATHDCPAC